MLNDQHYLRKIVSMGEKSRVITNRAITTENGIKLVDSGVHISERLYEKLTRHKLLPPIDECLSVEDAVTPQSLASSIEALLAEGNIGRFLVRAEEHDRILGLFEKFPLAPGLAFKLTVAREQAPHLYEQGLEVALCAVVLAMHGPQREEKYLLEAAAAGLFHDLGFLHVNADLIMDRRSLNESERRHVYAHPVLGSVILSRFPEWQPHVSRAVLEHHERMDGSGYPRALAASEISPLGQLLALAELIPTLFSRKRFIPLANQVHVVQRLNQGKFDRNLAGIVTELVQKQDAFDINWQVQKISYSETLSDLVELSVSILNWHAIAGRHEQLPMVDLINRRVERLERNCAGVGLDLQYWAMIDAGLPEDQSALSELAAVANEGRWQLRAIAQEVQRRWDSLCSDHQIGCDEIREWIERIEAEACGESAQASAGDGSP